MHSPNKLVRRISQGPTTPSSSKLRTSNESYSECDRFIPSRTASNLEDAFERMESNSPRAKQENQGVMDCMHNNQNMLNNLIRSELLGEPLQPVKADVSVSIPGGSTDSPLNSPTRTPSSVLRFSSSSRRYSGDSTGNGESPLGNSRSSFGPSPSPHNVKLSSKKNGRKISRIPYKVLDAPHLQDDYYLNLVDWSSTNHLSVALGNTVYLWSACNSKVTKLCELAGEDTVAAISWYFRKISSIGLIA